MAVSAVEGERGGHITNGGGGCTTRRCVPAGLLWALADCIHPISLWRHWTGEHWRARVHVAASAGRAGASAGGGLAWNKHRPPRGGLPASKRAQEVMHTEATSSHVSGSPWLLLYAAHRQQCHPMPKRRRRRLFSRRTPPRGLRNVCAAGRVEQRLFAWYWIAAGLMGTDRKRRQGKKDGRRLA